MWLPLGETDRYNNSLAAQATSLLADANNEVTARGGTGNAASVAGAVDAALDQTAAIAPSTVGTHAHPTEAQLSADKVAAGAAAQLVTDTAAIANSSAIVGVTTGTALIPDATGKYIATGIYNGYIYWKHITAAYYLWSNVAGDVRTISAVLGTAGAGYWTGGPITAAGTAFTHQGTALGDATVAWADLI